MGSSGRMADDVITLITAEHRRAEELFARLKAGQGDQAGTVAELYEQAQPPETVAHDCVTQPVSPYRTARIRRDGRLLAEHRRIAR